LCGARLALYTREKLRVPARAGSALDDRSLFTASANATGVPTPLVNPHGWTKAANFLGPCSAITRALHSGAR
jgi:hypothetical protein